MVYDAADGYVVLFGTDNDLGNPTNATWKFEEGLWTQLSPVASPGARTNAAMAYDASDGYVLLFGGYGCSTGNACTPTTLNDTWKFVGGQWTDLTSNELTSPPVRTYSAISSDGVDGYVVLFGGGAAGRVLGDTWKFAGGQWTELSPATSPSARAGAVMTYDATDGYVVLTGGSPLDTLMSSLNDTWKFVGGQWTNLSAYPSNPPGEASCGTIAYDAADGFVLCFNGQYGTYSFVAGKWTYLTPNGYPPGSTFGGWGMTYDAGDGFIVLFGGTGRFGTTNETWKFSDVPSPPLLVSAPAPDPILVDVNQTVTFATNASGGSGNYITYNWTESSPAFGCGPSTVAHISCSPTGAGTSFTVSVTVTDSAGYISPSATSGPYQVYASMVPAVSATPNPVALDQAVSFTSSVSGGSPPYTYSWSFGDGGTGGDLQNITHVYATTGTFNVSLRLMDRAAAAVVVFVTVTVQLSSASHNAMMFGLSTTEWVLLALMLVAGGIVGFVLGTRRRERPPGRSGKSEEGRPPSSPPPPSGPR